MLIVGAFWQALWLPWGCYVFLLGIYNCWFQILDFAEFYILLCVAWYATLLGGALFTRLWSKGRFIRIGAYNSLSIKTFILLCVLFVIHVGFLLYANFALACFVHCVLVFVALLCGWAAMRTELICICKKMVKFGEQSTKMYLHLFSVLILLYLAQCLHILRTQGWVPGLTPFWVQIIALTLITVYVVVCLIWMSVPAECRDECKPKKKKTCEDPCGDYDV